MHDEQVDSDESLVRRLLGDQFPQWKALEIRRVPSDGTDNALYRLGDELVARLPLIHWAVGQVEKEHRWLPQIAARLPLVTPQPLAMGAPGRGYPWHEFDADALTAIWEAAIAAPAWDGPPMCVHADLSDGNILARNGRLHAVIDFSAFGLGEPANDLDPAWGMFTGEARAAFREMLEPDDATWARARGWAVKSVYGILYYEHTNPGIVARCRRRVRALLDEVDATGST